MKTTRITVERNGNFTTVSNSVLRNANLSLKAVGLFVRVLGLPPDWDFSVRGLQKIVKEGRDAIYSALAELIEHGYVERKQHGTEGGQYGEVEYIFREEPQQKSGSQPRTGFPYTGFPYTDNPPQSKTISNKDIKKEKEIRETRREDAEDVATIFDYWVEKMKKTKATKLTPNRRRVIRSRLREGYKVEQILRAIDGCASSSFHMGKNDNHREYNDLTLICRNGEKVEQFEEMSNGKKGQGANGAERYSGRDSKSVLDSIGAG